ncbi:MAG: cyclic nucleotide-binding domain-containing protein, partial [Gemmiger sp.]|nr:cyclic nucleotide-binding domain-containing protein [Gemmiger sp.]
MAYSFLAKTPLFQGLTPTQVQDVLQCLGANQTTCRKGEYLCRVGDTAPLLGVVLAGGVTIESDDIWGNKTILNHVGPGQIFAEAYACLPDEPMMVSVVANQPTTLLLINVSRLLQVCPSPCAHHTRLIRNLLSVMAQKNLNLSRHI